MYQLSGTNSAEYLSTVFEKHWQHEQDIKRYSIYWAVYKSCRYEILLSGFTRGVGDLLQVAAPIVLLQLIQYIQATSAQVPGQIPPYQMGFVWVVVLFVV